MLQSSTAQVGECVDGTIIIHTLHKSNLYRKVKMKLKSRCPVKVRLNPQRDTINMRKKSLWSNQDATSWPTFETQHVERKEADSKHYLNTPQKHNA